jgi:hypothetical protein
MVGLFHPDSRGLRIGCQLCQSTSGTSNLLTVVPVVTQCEGYAMSASASGYYAMLRCDDWLAWEITVGTNRERGELKLSSEGRQKWALSKENETKNAGNKKRVVRNGQRLLL